MNRTHICILTATRAEYGLLKPVIKELLSDRAFLVNVAVTGMHLSPEFGSTYKDIENDGIDITVKIPILLSDDTPAGISKTMALAIQGFADYFSINRPDILLVLGDRYETLAVCCAAFNARIPIIHLYGGETTEGAADEAYRHAITKMSCLHLTSTEQYRKRVIQMGEMPNRAVVVGAVGIDNILSEKLLERRELEKSLNVKLDRKYAAVTFHPVTLENQSAGQQIEELLRVTEYFHDTNFIFTEANADADGRVINKSIREFAATHDNVYVFTSLGSVRYLSLLKHSVMVIGNSSSGLLEAPSLGIPTVNIGDRQRGRLQADSVINCRPIYDDILNAVQTALSQDFQLKAKRTLNPYGDGHATDRITRAIRNLTEEGINLKKKFYDINFGVEQ
jgi:GDP/UDP-N,N'-diacetylbacillosamine 2-epimerase (hydrolysing)